MWILQKIPPTGSGLLPGDNSPNWLTFNSNDSSVTFEVPEVDGRNLKTIMCIVYSSSADKTTTEGFQVVLVINYTKNTIQVCKRDGLQATYDEKEWQRVISNIEPGNQIKVIVGFTNEFIVKMTTIYLVYDDQPFDVKTKHCQVPDKNGIVSSVDEIHVLEQIVEETHLSSQKTVSVGRQISQVQPLQTSGLPEVVTSFGSCVPGSVKPQIRPKSDPTINGIELPQITIEEHLPPMPQLENTGPIMINGIELPQITIEEHLPPEARLKYQFDQFSSSISQTLDSLREQNEQIAAHQQRLEEKIDVQAQKLDSLMTLLQQLVPRNPYTLPL
ncbi:hypothetical protein TSUD_266300 [Trifolium subterraneum]|uniref:TIR domain-containing protein n=1 Tax=Trifolium subterraneum TaxID=3900 RepID=A0A2Z6NPZ0_TRISU|nr:hypothetical protein TSUD_266300 [Trifolium subterraneum]